MSSSIPQHIKALTVGGAMVDTIAIVESRHIERMSMKNAAESFLLLGEGSKTEAVEISTHTGGGAINACVAMARLGSDAASMVVLGRDQRGEAVLARLIEEGVSTRWVVRDDRATTGAAVMISSHDRNAAIFTYRGANTLLEPQHLKADAFGVDLVYVASLSNKSADCFPEIVARAKAAGAFVATNPGARQLSSRATALRASLPKIDLLAVNTAEADTMVPHLAAELGDGGPAFDDDGMGELPALAVRGLRGGGYDMSLRAFLRRMVELGVARIVVTDGSGGAFLADKQRVVHCPVAKTSVAGTAGAGDAFNATLAHLLASGADVERALRAASFNAASVVSFVDTQTGLMRRAALEAALAARSGELPVRTWAMS